MILNKMKANYLNFREVLKTLNYSVFVEADIWSGVVVSYRLANF